jgi:hypothetical protein
MDVTGTIYAPSAALQFNGGNTTNGSCTQVVANTISFLGNNKIAGNCSSSGSTQITPGSAGAVLLKE